MEALEAEASPEEGEELSPCNATLEDPRTASVRYYCYGVALPAVCALGILGNALNLLVLTRRNMKGTAYVYMRGYAAASLLAIAFAIPFGVRVLEHESGRWTSRAQAFYHVHLELFLGNACLGVGVLMLLALTVERYVAVCHPGRTRPLVGPPRRVVALIPLFTFAVYLPGVFRARLGVCVLPPDGEKIYVKVDNDELLKSAWHAAYVVLLEAAFKVGPTLLLAALNLRILVVYRRSCERRRRRCARASTAISYAAAGNGKSAAAVGSGGDHGPHEGGGGGGGDPRSGPFAEERRLVLLLGSTSILFLVCVSPMVILNVTLSDRNLSIFSYQVFRAVANLLEVTNYSLTFYIYCLFSEDFRATLLRTLRWPWPCCAGDGVGGGAVGGAGGRSGCPPTPRSGRGGDIGGGRCVSNGGRALLEPRRCTPPTNTTTTTTTATTGTSGSGTAGVTGTVEKDAVGEDEDQNGTAAVATPPPRTLRVTLCCGAKYKSGSRAAV